MLGHVTLLPFTMILGLPLMSACSDQPSEASLSGCTGDKFWVKVTRRNDGDALISACPRCGDLCRQAKAVRLRCDLKEYPCTCRCPYNQTFIADINLCVDTFSDCSFSASKPSRISLIESRHNTSASEHCRVRKTSVFKCGAWTNLDSLNITHDRNIWKVARETDSAGRNVWWTGSLDAFQSLSGYLLYLDISCDSFTESTSCAVVKMAGTRGYAVSNSPSMNPTTGNDITTEGGIPILLVTSNGTSSNTTAGMTAEEYKQLEMLVTAVCLSVALLLCVWLTCFAVEKRVQSKKRGSEKQYASQTRTYPHEVAHVRKTLMDVYDMPMIRFNMSGEDDDGTGLTIIQPKKKEKEVAIAEVKPNHEADGEYSTSPSSSELRAETGSSTETLAMETSASQVGFLGVPKVGNPDDQEFKNWRPCLKQQPAGGTSKKSPPLSPTKKKANPPGILKRSPNTSPTRSPTRSPLMPKPSPIKNILIKRSPTLHKRWKTAVSRHFQHTNQNHADGVELKTVNGLKQEPSPAPKRSILKHGSRWRALAPKLVPMVKAEELDDDIKWDGGEDTKHQVVIKCEIHHENERRETDVDSDEKMYTEKSPLTKTIKVVLDARLDAPTKKNCIKWRCDDIDGVPCTDV